MKIIAKLRPFTVLLALCVTACGGGGGGSSNATTPPPSFTTTPAIAAGASHTLVLKANGTVWGWGDNSSGQLGIDDDSKNNSITPVQVRGLNHVVAISAREKTSMALKADGTVWTWGFGGDAQLGVGGPEPAPSLVSYKPVKVTGLPNIKAVSMGFSHALALATDGRIWAWGNNSYGQMGAGVSGPVTTPVVIQGNLDFIAIAAGGTSSVALKTDGYAYAWGDNSTGQLAQGNTTAMLGVKIISPLSYGRFSEIAMGRSHVLAIAGDYDDLVGWGFNDSGQVGDDSFVTRTGLSTNPVLARRWMAIAAGEYFSVGLDSSGVWVWGDNTYYQSATGNPLKQPRPSIALNSNPDRTFTDIAAGSSHVIALTGDGRVFTWGLNDAGQLGRVTADITDSWNQVSGFSVND